MENCGRIKDGSGMLSAGEECAKDLKEYFEDLYNADTEVEVRERM